MREFRSMGIGVCGRGSVWKSQCLGVVVFDSCGVRELWCVGVRVYVSYGVWELRCLKLVYYPSTVTEVDMITVATKKNDNGFGVLVGLIFIYP